MNICYKYHMMTRVQHAHYVILTLFRDSGPCEISIQDRAPGGVLAVAGRAYGYAHHGPRPHRPMMRHGARRRGRRPAAVRGLRRRCADARWGLGTLGYTVPTRRVRATARCARAPSAIRRRRRARQQRSRPAAAVHLQYCVHSLALPLDLTSVIMHLVRPQRSGPSAQPQAQPQAGQRPRSDVPCYRPGHGAGGNCEFTTRTSNKNELLNPYLTRPCMVTR